MSSITEFKFLCFCLMCACNWFCSGVKADAVFQCDFEVDMCGLINDMDASAKWNRTQMDLGDRSGMVAAVIADGSKKETARLLSPFIEGHWNGVEGCLSFDLYTAGDGVTSVRIKRQDNNGVFRLLGIHNQVSNWRTFKVHMDVDDFVRFIFEAHVNPLFGKATVAMDNILFKLEDCDE